LCSQERQLGIFHASNLPISLIVIIGRFMGTRLNRRKKPHCFAVVGSDVLPPPPRPPHAPLCLIAHIGSATQRQEELKGRRHEIFPASGFFHESSSPKPLKIPLCQCAPPVSITPAANLPPVPSICVIDTSGKLPPVPTTLVLNLPLVSTPPVANDGNNIGLLTP
jgi:hypothetical protein